jgi:hypothetical protein
METEKIRTRGTDNIGTHDFISKIIENFYPANRKWVRNDFANIKEKRVKADYSVDIQKEENLREISLGIDNFKKEYLK